MPPHRRTATDRRPRAARRPVLGAETRATYRHEVTTSGTSTTNEPTPADEPPLGLPVLAEVPELGEPLELFAQVDAMLVRAVLALARLLEADQDRAVDTTGVGIEHWLALTSASPRLERRTWLRAARLLLRLPGLRGQVEAGHVSAGQLRALTIALRGIPADVDAELDTWLTDAARSLHTLEADPDALIEQARQALAELTDHTERTEDDADVGRHLRLQPRLDGSGGTFSGSEDAYGFALLEAATRPRADQLHDPSRGRADNLQAALHGLDAGTAGDATRDIDLPASADADPPVVHRSWAHAAADAARRAADDAADDEDREGLPERIAGYADAGALAPPKVLVRAELSTLLATDRLPADVLIALTGGKLRLTAAAARALIDTHGADLRLIVTDHGEVVGVGRSARVARGWLTDATHAIHDRCTRPLCDRPALGADTDHARAWTPDAAEPAGTTDLDNLGPLCRRTNRDRAATGWHPRQHSTDGVRTWSHTRSGLTVTSIPATWRPPARRPPPAVGHDPPDTPDPTRSRDDLPF